MISGQRRSSQGNITTYFWAMAQLLVTDQIQGRILLIRGQYVMLDFVLAELYDVSTKSLNQAVKRNIERFPQDFMFQLSELEWARLNDFPSRRSQIVTASQRFRNSKFLPFVFSEQGVAMLSSVLRSKTAIQVNIAIMRAFVMLHKHRDRYKELAGEIEKLEQQMNRKFTDVFEALNFLAEHRSTAKEIGFSQKGRA